MQPIINQFIAALLNEEQDTARELLDQYLLMRAKEIHASFVNGDSALLSENLDDDIISEQYFTDEDLADHDEDHADASDELSGEMHTDDADADSDDMHADDDSDMSADDDMGDDSGEDEDVDDRVDDLEAKLDELTAEFERMMAQLDGDDSDSEDDDVLGSDHETETSADGEAETTDMDDEHKFPDATESFVSDREVIKTMNMDGRGTDGKMIVQNKKSLPFDRSKDGTPIKSKNVTHKGYERETPPSSGRLPKGINTQDHADSKLMKSPPKGDPKATINAPIKGNDVSPVAKRKK
jgi:hypothetical protein